MRWKTIAIIGVGLIGGSVGLALRRRQICPEVVGIGRRLESLEKAQQVGAVTRFTTDMAEGVREAELVVVCSPVEAIAEHVLSAAGYCRPGTILTDAGSTKEQIVREIENRLDRNVGVHFVGGHPIAGSERTGPEAARADLFEGRAVVITPTAHTAPDAVDQVDAFWQSLGANTYRQTPAAHDRVLASTSHLPHLVAAALAANTAIDDLPFTGSGWCDTTRIAAGDPELWRQILIQNQRYVLESLSKLMKLLERFQTALDQQDERQLVGLLTAGKNHRDAVGN